MRTGTTGSRVQEVFVSPRVIDQAAFQELAGSLGDMLAKAASEREAVAAAHTDLKAIHKALLELHESQSARLDAAGTIAENLRQRETSSRTLLGEIDQQAERAELTASRLESALTEKLSAFEQRLESALLAAEERLTAQFASDSRGIEDRIRHLNATLEEQAGPVEHKLKELAERANNGLNELRETIRTEFTPTLRSLDSACDRAEFLLGRPVGSDRPPSEGSLGGLIAQANCLRDEVHRAIHDVEAATTGGAQAAAALSRAVSDSARAIDEFSSRSGTAADSARETVARCEQAERALRDRMRETERVLREPVLELKAEADRAVERLRGLIAQAEDSRRRAEQSAEFMESARRELTGLLEQLEPWRRAFDSAEEGQLPEPLRRIVDELRGEIGRDLRHMAGAMRAIAERAEAVVEPEPGL